MKYLIAAAAALFLIAWGVGAGNCGCKEIYLLLSGGELDPASRAILLELRLPRLLAAFLTGGMLAASGCASQHLFRNDLASPHVLGVVNSSALGAVCGLLLGGYLQTPLSILAGLLSLLLILLPGRRWGWDAPTLILTGIAVNALASAMTSGALFLADERLNSLVFWLLGGFWRITWKDCVLLAATALPGWTVLYYLSPEMDLLLLGDRTAGLSGLRLQRVKPLALFCIALLTAVAVSCCGVIGFVGLAVPHIVRFFAGASFRKLLPAAIVSGGILLLSADLLARTLAAPQEIPVGILTALAGGPFFFWLLLRKGGKSAF
jgi:iron complex transport system permease protein